MYTKTVSMAQLPQGNFLSNLIDSEPSDPELTDNYFHKQMLRSGLGKARHFYTSYLEIFTICTVQQRQMTYSQLSPAVETTRWRVRTEVSSLHREKTLHSCMLPTTCRTDKTNSSHETVVKKRSE